MRIDDGGEDESFSGELAREDEPRSVVFVSDLLRRGFWTLERASIWS